MKTRFLGNSDLKVGRMGMGCWSFGGGSYWGEQAQSDVDSVVAVCLENGVNYFDTAEAYNDGESEVSLGKALKDRRSAAVVGTKISASNVGRGLVRRHCEESLKRLGTDYIDLYMLHWPINQKALEGFSGQAAQDTGLPTNEDVFEDLYQLKKDGKIRWIGVSNHGVKQMEQIRQTGVEIIANELPYNLISRAIEGDIAAACSQNGIGIIGYMAMQQGILANIYQSIDEIPAAQAHSRHFANRRGGDMSRHYENGAEDEINDLMSELRKISAEIGIGVPTLSLAYALNYDKMSCTLVGSRNTKQLFDNLKTEAWSMPHDLRKKLDEISKPVLDKLGDSPDYYESRATSRIF